MRSTEHGLTERTLIAFISDHGDLLGDHYAWGKRSFYEGSARVPFLVSWPGRLPGGQTREHLVSGCDLLPTFLAAAGATEAVPANVEGQNLLPICTDGTSPGHDSLVGQFSSGRLMKLMLRWDDWKYCYFRQRRPSATLQPARRPARVRRSSRSASGAV